MEAIGKGAFVPQALSIYSRFTGKSGINMVTKTLGKMKMYFLTTGEGPSGDMEFTRGNLALRDQLKKRQRVFLFEQSRKGFSIFISEMTFFDCDY